MFKATLWIRYCALHPLLTRLDYLGNITYKNFWEKILYKLVPKSIQKCTFPEWALSHQRVPSSSADTRRGRLILQRIEKSTNLKYWSYNCLKYGTGNHNHCKKRVWADYAGVGASERLKDIPAPAGVWGKYFQRQEIRQEGIRILKFFSLFCQ